MPTEPRTEPRTSEERAIEAFREYVASLPGDSRPPLPGPARTRGGRGWLVPLVAAALVAVLVWAGGSLPPSRVSAPPGGSGDARPSMPDRLAPLSYFTSRARPGEPERGVLAYQQGHGVELMDFPQFVVLSADGDLYRRVGQVEALADSDGDFPPTRLSPDGRLLAIGKRSDPGDDEPSDVLEVLHLSSGVVDAYDIPGDGRGVSPVAWAADGRSVWLLLTAGENEVGSAVQGPLARLALDTGRVDVATDVGSITGPDRVGDPLSWVAPSPTARYVAVGTRGSEVVLEGSSLRTLGTWRLPGELVGNGWSPDGRRLLTRSEDTLYVHAMRGPEPVGEAEELPLPYERDFGDRIHALLAWTSPTTAVFGRNFGTGGEPTSLVEVDLLSGDLRTLSRLERNWTGAGITGVTMATGLAQEMSLREAGPADRGPLRLYVLAGLAVVVAAWAAWRLRRRRGP